MTTHETKPRDNFYALPADLPVPQDDGGCDHLKGMSLPAITLSSTSLNPRRLSEVTHAPTVIFLYPRTGRPDEPAPEHWDEIPGARGCTPQSCGFRDLYQKFQALGLQVFGLSTQTTEFHQELVSRIHLPYEVLSDAEFKLTDALKLPTFEFNGMRLLKRMAWFCEFGKVQKVFYPVFPSIQNAETVLAWAKAHLAQREPIKPLRLDLDGSHFISDIMPADRSAYLEYLKEKQIHDQTLAIPFPYTEADADKWINHVAEMSRKQGRSVNWAIRKSDGSLIGGIGFHDFELGKSHKAEIGYWLAQPFWGQGIMTKAVQKATEFGFKELGLSRISANVFDFNDGSVRVLEKAGYCFEGLLRKSYRKNGKVFDGKLYARVSEP
jgi:RimJ/RimL family protein N-acetyltransferase